MKNSSMNMRFFIHTLGCKVNQYESQAIREILVGAGFKECLSKETADLYIVNTCTVTDKADRESRHWIGTFHKTNPKSKIVVTGCSAEQDADNISFLPGVAYIIKNADKARIADILNGIIGSKLLPLSITDFKGHTKAFVKIQDGCENRCSYCKVPLVRGALSSRPIDDIVKEVRALSDKGFKEIVLTGICLGAWGKDIVPGDVVRASGLKEPSIVDVLKAIDGVGGDFRVRLSSIEPLNVTDELLEYMAGNVRICRHLHIPLQSGDDEILRKMNRPYRSSQYKAIVERAISRIKDLAVTTDIMIGFPGESNHNFKNTIDLVKEILPARTHIFTFSKRPGTDAWDMVQSEDHAALKRRFYELQTASFGASYLYRSRFLGRKLDVLVETRRDKLSGWLCGYSDNYIRVQFQGDDSFMKRLVPVKIDDVSLIRTLGVC
ncbi:MAG: tRNA (N(6)-L-threonylcarbamoyladenosine(37)-C(2))-methylthiotransferase MtaB [Candidatus Omnitrophica bacterium]|nr:tRNA (N(6)-L-threonylcarbamoyladenosine(37)-C(2))-methylthiotransferase MtaB [Candidatus Omnitrophota bacterium]